MEESIQEFKTLWIFKPNHIFPSIPLSSAVPHRLFQILIVLSYILLVRKEISLSCTLQVSLDKGTPMSERDMNNKLGLSCAKLR